MCYFIGREVFKKIFAKKNFKFKSLNSRLNLPASVQLFSSDIMLCCWLNTSLS